MPTAADIGTRNAAITYARLGLAVFPLHGVFGGRCECGRRCGTVGKHPLISGWQRTIPSVDAADRAWPRGTGRGIGLTCGPNSGVWTLDVDPRARGISALAELEDEYGALPTTWESRTGSGGRHLIFAWPEDREIRNSAGHVGPGLDVRGVGGFVVLPPSRHASGEAYAWIHPPSTRLASAPAWLLDLVTARTRPSRPAEPGALIGVGQRHAALVSLLGLMRSWGANEATLLGAAEAFVRTQCVVDPRTPIDMRRVLKTVRSVTASWDPDPMAPRSIDHYRRGGTDDG